MIVGRGMLARAFDKYRDQPDIVIFASGVSDSTEADLARFHKEEALLTGTLEEQGEKRFVYFGTCSVADPDSSASPYVRHKLNMERLIQAYSSRNLIFRLPQVVGRGGNKNTLINRLYASISQGEQFQLWRNAFRYIIDVDDVSIVGRKIIDRAEHKNRIINIASCRFSILEIVRALEDATQCTAIYAEVDKGASYDIDCHEAHEVAKLLNIRFDETYLRRVIRKYYSPIGRRQTAIKLLPGEHTR